MPTDPYTTGLVDAVARWRADQDRAEASRLAVQEAVRAAHAAGLSEHAIARVSGLARDTVRNALGK